MCLICLAHPSPPEAQALLSSSGSLLGSIPSTLAASQWEPRRRGLGRADAQNQNCAKGNTYDLHRRHVFLDV